VAFDVQNSFIDEGPLSIESEGDVAACLPGLRATSSRIVSQGWDALVINCMCDPGVEELRATHTVPVFGPSETSMHIAATMGRRFSILDVSPGGRDIFEAQVLRYGLTRYYVSYRAINTPILELNLDPASTVADLEAQALLAFKDGADSVILGCTGLAELVNRLRQALASHGSPGVVMEPLRTTLAAAQAVLMLNIGDSLAERVGRRRSV
jgi:allantoin racemase